MDILASILGLLKALTSALPFAIVVALCGTLVLALPSAIASKLHVEWLRHNYATWIGPITLFAWLSVAVLCVAKILSKRASERDCIAHLESLSDGEKVIVKFCVWKNQQQVILKSTDPHAMSLVRKGILIPAHSGTHWSYSFIIASFVWDHLRKRRAAFEPTRDEIPLLKRLAADQW